MNRNFGTKTGLATSFFVSHEGTKARRHEGRRTKDEGRRTKDEGRRTKDEATKVFGIF